MALSSRFYIDGQLLGRNIICAKCFSNLAKIWTTWGSFSGLLRNVKWWPCYGVILMFVFLIYTALLSSNTPKVYLNCSWNLPNDSLYNLHIFTKTLMWWLMTFSHVKILMCALIKITMAAVKSMHTWIWHNS